MVGDREQIASEVANRLVNRLFASGLELHRALRSTSNAQSRASIEAALDEIDAAIQIIRLAAVPSEFPERGTGPAT